MKKKLISKDKLIAKAFSYTFISFAAILCLLPFWLVIVGSFSSNESILKEGFGLSPREFSLEAYKYVFQKPDQILNAYKVTILVTVCGTALSVFLTTMAAYVLSRKDYPYRNLCSFYFFFTTIFSGGLVPRYVLCVRYLHFKEMPYVALIVPMLFNFFYMIMLRSFMSTIPESIVESAKMDGAGDFYIYAKLIVPLSKSAIATVVLFTMMGYWNDYYNPMLYVADDKYVSLQYYLYKTINTMKGITSQMISTGVQVRYPSESFKMAMTVIATGPILLVYPFVQKYLVKGVTVGAVKG